MNISKLENNIIVAGFDPPSIANMGWAILAQENFGELLDGGVLHFPDNESERLLLIRDFVIDIIEKYKINIMAFEKSIGNGFAATRAKICENTGVIKLAGASYGIKLEEIHTSTMALQFTGYGGGKDKNGISKKSRIKQTARDIFYPDESFKSIVNNNGVECFEHLGDAIGFAATYLLQLGISVKGSGGIINPGGEIIKNQ